MPELAWPDTLTAIGQNLKKTRTDEKVARAQAHKAAVEAVEAGQPEAAVARYLGVDRMTVRKWRGKATAASSPATS